MGSATAWHLSNAGHEVLLLEQQDPTYSSGSSFGEARICRSLGPKNDIWSYLHRRAVGETETLLDFLNTKDSVHHRMQDIYTDSPVTYILHTDRHEVVRRMLRQQPDKSESSHTPEEAMEKFGVSFPEDQIMIQEYRKYSGTMNPKALINKLHRAIALQGNQIRYGQQIKSIKRVHAGYEADVLDLKQGEVHTLKVSRVVSAAGPYTGTLLREIAPEFSELITPKRVFLAFLKISKDRFESYSSAQKEKIFNFYPLIDLGPDHIFSMIEKTDSEGIPLIKVGGHFQRSEILNLDNVWSKELAAEEIEFATKGILNYFKLLNIPLQFEDLIYQNGYSCVYSLTESEVPIVANLPTKDGGFDPNAVVLGGMSGVGAKGSMTYGKIASDLLLANEEEEEEDYMYQKVKDALRLERH